MARRLAASSAPVKVFFYIIKHHCHGCARAFSPHHSRGTNLYVFPNKYVKISCVISKITVFQTFAPSRLRLTSGYPLRQALAGLPRASPNSTAQETQAFLRALELRIPAGVMRNGARRRGFLIPNTPVRGSAGWARTAAK